MKEEASREMVRGPCPLPTAPTHQVSEAVLQDGLKV